jgi:hypothetical protein
VNVQSKLQVAQAPSGEIGVGDVLYTHASQSSGQKLYYTMANYINSILSSSSYLPLRLNYIAFFVIDITVGTMEKEVK